MPRDAIASSIAFLSAQTRPATSRSAAATPGAIAAARGRRRSRHHGALSCTCKVRSFARRSELRTPPAAARPRPPARYPKLRVRAEGPVVCRRAPPHYTRVRRAKCPPFATRAPSAHSACLPSLWRAPRGQVPAGLRVSCDAAFHHRVARRSALEVRGAAAPRGGARVNCSPRPRCCVALRAWPRARRTASHGPCPSLTRQRNPWSRRCARRRRAAHASGGVFTDGAAERAVAP